MSSEHKMDSQILIYQFSEGNIKVDVQLEDETVWLTQAQMSLLFNKAKSTINEHIKNIFLEGELLEADIMKKFGNSEFQQKAANYYNLDVVISVGYRVKSKQGTQFRIWATQRLKEYIIKGFALNDARFKTGQSMNYSGSIKLNWICSFWRISNCLCISSSRSSSVKRMQYGEGWVYF